MAEESKKIIDDISVIQKDIDKYQVHIDDWIKKIDLLGSSVHKISGTKDSFQIKANNIMKIKEYLTK